MWLIKRLTEKGGYIADQRKRGGHTYTKHPRHMKVYKTLAEAKGDTLEQGELVVGILELFGEE